MGNKDEQLIEVVKEIAEGEGISFKEAIKLSITTLKAKFQRSECCNNKVRKEGQDY